MGKVFKFHNDLDTDQIIASQYLLLPTIDDMKSHAMESQDPTFAERVQPGDFVVGGSNFGCGSSREQAPSVLKALGVKAVIAKSIARIHKGNLVNHGVIPMLFEDGADYDRLEQTDELHIDNLREQIAARRVQITDKTKGFSFWVKLELTDKEIEVVLNGGQLRTLKKQLEAEKEA